MLEADQVAAIIQIELDYGRPLPPLEKLTFGYTSQQIRQQLFTRVPNGGVSFENGGGDTYRPNFAGRGRPLSELLALTEERRRAFDPRH